MHFVKRAALASAAVILTATVTAAPANAATPHKFANCDAMHKVFPHGVGKIGAHDKTSGTPVTNFARKPLWYKKNAGSDRDKDGIACEAA
ncbi:excalibur calcium-binding domain-containing protein [Nocardioides ungokensis]|uniref:excalibur calcium-binding domain-containing protein n=1 Tax=Nocardioides ungokensis TaxID=1643322 RepID=UPI0015DEA301|nr:excalibur calcium-binding domain-containing protein [Nocardioides ungokensis]